MAESPLRVKLGSEDSLGYLVDVVDEQLVAAWGDGGIDQAFFDTAIDGPVSVRKPSVWADSTGWQDFGASGVVCDDLESYLHFRADAVHVSSMTESPLCVKLTAGIFSCLYSLSR
jgi:hypothetical protein